jgi:hypothetical protein
MKLPFLVVLVLYSSGLYCQSAGPEVLASSGGSSDDSNISVSWTMGETVINELSIPGYWLSQGFQQGFLSIVSEIQDLPTETLITAYPNPVSNALTIKIVSPSHSNNWSLTVYDFKGIVVIQRETDEDITEVNFSSLPAGAYLVQLRHQSNYKIFNIIKQ